ncbi:MAG TPA: hypothetical protein PLV45_18720 [bacterium]|nr:hypothetical protein [bacterium]
MKHWFVLIPAVFLVVCGVSAGGSRITPTPTPFFDFTGDVNFSYTLTPEDSQITLLYALGYWSPTPVADCNCDGEVTPQDSILIFNGLFLGSYCTCPVPNPPGTFTPTPTPALPLNQIYCTNDGVGCPGDMVFMDIRMSNPDYPVDCLGIDFQYNPEIMSFESAGAGDLDPGWFMFDADEVSPGTVRIAAWSLDGYEIPAGSDGVLAELGFTAICPDCYEGELYPYTIHWMTDDLQPFQPVHGNLEINCVYPVHNGDANLDHALSAGDAQLTFLNVLGLVSFTFQQFTTADCNSDYQVTAEDAQMIFETLMGYSQCTDPL